MTMPHVVPDQPSAFCDLEAEQAVLGACLLDRAALAVVRLHVSPGDFVAERHREMAAAMWRLGDAGEPIDVLTMRRELDTRGVLRRCGGVEAIAELSLACPSSVSAEGYAKIVAGAARRRRLREGLILAMRELETGSLEEVEATIDRARTVPGATAAPALRRMRDVVGDVADDLAAMEASRDGVIGLRTGLSRLDALLGGLRAGQLVVLAARPALGKTTLATQMVWAMAAQGARALLVSAEMPAREIVLRMVGAASGADSVSLRADGITGPVSQALGRLADLPLWIDDTAGITTAQIRARACYLRAQGGLDVIAVDYVGMLGVDDRRMPRVEQIAGLTRDLKALAKEVGVPVVLLSQLNRQSEQDGRRPRLSDLRDSGALEQDADVVLFLWRDRTAQPRVDRRQDVELIVAKHRGGPRGVVPVLFDGPRFTFAEAAGNDAFCPSTP